MQGLIYTNINRSTVPWGIKITPQVIVDEFKHELIHLLTRQNSLHDIHTN